MDKISNTMKFILEAIKEISVEHKDTKITVKCHKENNSPSRIAK